VQHNGSKNGLFSARNTAISIRREGNGIRLCNYKNSCKMPRRIQQRMFSVVTAAMLKVWAYYVASV